jgi:drug/metabolite transporter (DMT)-like permease
MNFQAGNHFNFWVVLCVSLWIILNASSQISIKFGLSQVKEERGGDSTQSGFFQDNFIFLLTNKLIVIGVILFAISTICWFIAMANLEISVLSPMGSLVFVLTAIFAVIILKEEIPLLRWIGIGLVIFGVYLITRT